MNQTNLAIRIFTSGDAAKSIVRLQDNLKGLQKQASSFVKKAAVFGGAGFLAIKGMQTGFEAQAGFKKLQIIMDETDKGFAKMKTHITDVAQVSSFSLGEVMQAYQDTAKAGYNMQESMNSVPSVLALAEATGSSPVQAAEVVNGLINAFGLAKSDAAVIAGKLVVAANASGAGIEDLSESLKVSAPLAKIMGQSIDGLLSSLGSLADINIKGSTAGTALKAMARVLPATGEMKKMLKNSLIGADLSDAFKELGGSNAMLSSLGVSAVDSVGKMRPLVDILGDIGKALPDMSQRVVSLNAIFGVEQGGKMAGLISQIESGKTAALQKKIEGASAGSAVQQAGAMLDTLSGDWLQLGGAVDKVSFSFAEVFAPALRNIVQVFARFLGFVARFVDSYPNFIRVIGYSVAVLGVLLTTLSALKLSFLVGQVALFGLKVGFLSTASGVGVLRAALILLSSHPIIAAISATVAVIMLLAANIDKVKQAYDAFFGSNKENAVKALFGVEQPPKDGQASQKGQNMALWGGSSPSKNTIDINIKTDKDTQAAVADTKGSGDVFVNTGKFAYMP